MSGSVCVGTGVSGIGVTLGALVRGIGVTEVDGDALEEGEGDDDGLADGAATCCEEITAAPRRSSATSATAAKTVKTVDQRSAGRRTAAGREGAGAAFASAGGRSSCAVASGSTRGGLSPTREGTARAMPNGRTLDRSAARRDAGRWRPDFRSRPD